MSGNATTTANKQTSYGSADTKNQIKPGGKLGSGRYYPIVDASTGKIDVYKYGKTGNTKIGEIPRGGQFTGLGGATNNEIQYFSSAAGKQKFRDNAKQVVTNEWDGKSQPPPNTVVWGDNAINKAYGAKNSSGEVFAGTRPEEGGAAIPSEDALLQQNAVDTHTSSIQSKLLEKGLGKVKKSNTSLGPGQIIVYPQGLRQKGAAAQDHIKLQMLEYSPKKMGVQNDLKNLSGVGGRAKNRKGLGSVLLPIPGGIMDTNAVSWGGDTMDPVAAAMANISYAALVQGKGTEEIKNVADKVKSNQGEVKKAIGLGIAAMATQTGAQLLKRTEGVIMNPNMELLFNNPSLRQFNFTWKLAPRSRKEAETVIKIIRFFKQGMAPIREEPNLFLKSPNTFQLTYKHKQSDHKFLNKFKECALVNCGVQYTPDGNYATFEDGVMTAYQMVLSFQELDPVYSDDYNGISNTEIGF